MDEQFEKQLAESNPKPVRPPPPVDVDHHLASYYVSSSHNTYLQGNQLEGKATEKSYEHVLAQNGRCVEIDAWDGEDGTPIVYHGWTLTEPVPITGIIAAIGRGIKGPDSLPILIAVENHCSAPQQDKMAQLFKEGLGDKLISKELEGLAYEDVKLKDVLGKILIIIEHYGGIGADQMREPAPQVDLPDSDDEVAGKTRTGADDDERKVKEKKKKSKSKITPALAELGVYTQSVKPPEGTWWLDKILAPMQRVVNISEAALTSVLPTSISNVLDHTNSHLMRVYPAGLRVTSKNLDPAPFWRAGSQICALNWQTHDLGRQLNDALFDGTGGWVLKPEHLRGTERGDDPRTGKRKLEVVIFGAKGLPDISDVGPGKKLEPYVKVDLVSSQGRKRHTTKTFKPKKGDIGRNPVWGDEEKASFEWDDEYLVFLRIRIWHYDGMFERDDHVASYTASIDRLEQGWLSMPLYSVHGDPLDNAVLLVHVKLD